MCIFRYHYCQSGIKNDARFKWEDREIDAKSNPYEKLHEGDFVVNIEYQGMDVEVETEVVLVAFNDFVSATGGALGLFLGFSIIDTLFYLYDIIHKKMLKKAK